VTPVKGQKGLEIEFEKWKIEKSRDSVFSESHVSIPGRIKKFISLHQCPHRACAKNHPHNQWLSVEIPQGVKLLCVFHRMLSGCDA